MIKVDYKNCSGCGACENICAVDAIKMVKNSEGFLYPEVNVDICVNCGKCEQVCQIQTEYMFDSEKRRFFAVWQINENERQKSATGGMCALVAKYVIEKGGYFCSAAFVNGKLKHVLTNEWNFFDKHMRGSKYFQSEIGNVYFKVLQKLKEGRMVAFVGTPCQVSGLKLFLGKDYENLYLIDLICHGVPSAKVFEQFVKSNGLSECLNEISLNFRDKEEGWHNSHLTLKNGDNVFYNKEIKEDPFCKAFLNDICLRESCYYCKYTDIRRVSDMMVGDFWGAPKSIDDNKGINLISVNKKGLFLLDEIKKELYVKEFSSRNVLQPQLKKPTKKHFNRDNFFSKLDSSDFNSLVEKMLSKENNVGLLNFHWENNNYGALLTAYALNKYINSLGYNAYNIDYVPSWGKNSISTSNFSDFRAKYLPLTSRCETIDELKALNKNFGIFIVGSDQVFNWDFISKDFGVYFFSFVNDENKKIAYSASFGEKDFKAPSSKLDQVGLLLSRFNDIGVREKSGVGICRNVFKIKAKHVLDPVFLLSPEEWKRIANVSIKSCDNIYYIVNAELNKEADEYLKDFTSIRYDLNIEDWLGKIINSSFVITDSFHALCFCLIFNKQFVYVGKNNGRQERVKSLFEMFDLPKSLFFLDKKLENFKLPDMVKVNYDTWQKNLDVYLRESKEFLLRALEKENEKMYDPYYFLFKKLEKKSNLSNFKYWKYKILSKITFGKKRKKYKAKYRDLK